MFLSHIKELLAPETDLGDKGGSDKKTVDTLSFLHEDDEEETINLEENKKNDKEKEVKDKNEETDEEIEDIKKKDKETEEEDKEDEENDDDSEEDDLSEFEDDLEDPSEEDLELEEDVPTRREILKVYPELFKKFPQLEKSYFRERQFSKYFANPKDAESAVTNSETLDKLNNDIINGDISKILLAAKNYGGEKVFHKLVDNYLDTLQKVDKDAHQHIFANVIKHTIGHMVVRARKNGDEDLLKLAEGLNKFIFNSDEYEPPSKLSKEGDDSSADDKVSKREQELLQQKFDDSHSEMNNRVSNILRGTIKANIDKKGEMSDFVRNAATREAMEMVENLLNKDTRLKQIVDKLWESAVKDNFSRKSLDKIKDAFSSRAKTLLPSVIQKARKDALRGIAKKKVKAEKDNNEEEETQDTEKPNSKPKGRKPENLSGIDTLEYLMRD